MESKVEHLKYFLFAIQLHCIFRNSYKLDAFYIHIVLFSFAPLKVWTKHVRVVSNKITLYVYS